MFYAILPEREQQELLGREVLGGSNQKRNPQLVDRFICILQYDEAGVLHMFYAILPEREQQELLASQNEFEDDDVLHYDYDD